MQDPSIYSQIKPQFPDQEHLKCPRCDSANTKFCYYNNYNLSQPRHFCKNCRRYWTKGGALRNIPVGGGSRKNTKRSSSSTKRSSSATSASSATPSSSPSSAAVAASTPPSSSPTPPATAQTVPKTEPYGASIQPASDQDRRIMIDTSGNYSSLLSSNEGQYGNFYEGSNPNGSNLQLYGFGEQDLNRGLGSVSGSAQHGEPVVTGLQNTGNNSEGFLNGENNNGDSGIWNGANGWPDLAIYTPGSNFQ